MHWVQNLRLKGGDGGTQPALAEREREEQNPVARKINWENSEDRRKHRRSCQWRSLTLIMTWILKIWRGTLYLCVKGSCRSQFYLASQSQSAKGPLSKKLQTWSVWAHQQFTSGWGLLTGRGRSGQAYGDVIQKPFHPLLTPTSARDFVTTSEKTQSTRESQTWQHMPWQSGSMKCWEWQMKTNTEQKPWDAGCTVVVSRWQPLL